MKKTGSARVFFATTAVVLAVALTPTPRAAETHAVVPGFWDPNLRLERPDLSGVRAIRFLTSDDYPPFNFAQTDGSLTGFNVEIARAICDELDIACTIQARPWSTLIESLEDGKGDAVIASIAVTPALRARIDFSHPYYQTPARFIARKGALPAGSGVSAATLAG